MGKQMTKKEENEAIGVDEEMSEIKKPEIVTMSMGSINYVVNHNEVVLQMNEWLEHVKKEKFNHDDFRKIAQSSLVEGSVFSYGDFNRLLFNLSEYVKGCL